MGLGGDCVAVARAVAATEKSGRAKIHRTELARRAGRGAGEGRDGHIEGLFEGGEGGVGGEEARALKPHTS